MGFKWMHFVKDYCYSCTLTGLKYVANANIHFTERFFWLVAVVLSAVGCYHLIHEYFVDYESKAVGIIYEELSPKLKFQFPSIGICEYSSNVETTEAIERYLDMISRHENVEYDYDVEAYVNSLIFPNLYHQGYINSHCGNRVDCTDCLQCPYTNYRKMYNALITNCSDIFKSCKWSEQDFECCKYFLPLTTPYGNCFMLNSLQNNKPGSRSWLNLHVDPATMKAKLRIIANRSLSVFILNEEDIPHTALPSTSLTIHDKQAYRILQISKTVIGNDPEVRLTSPSYRKCQYPDELIPYTAYKRYSFSTCISDCIRTHQVKLCNCTVFTLNPWRILNLTDCDYNGYICLEQSSMVKPDAKALSPWGKNSISCNCLPSCNEHYISTVFEGKEIFREGLTDINDTGLIRIIDIVIPKPPLHIYRRYALRTHLDTVVTIGGIMGLFLGASILSAIEILFFIFSSVLKSLDSN